MVQTSEILFPKLGIRMSLFLLHFREKITHYFEVAPLWVLQNSEKLRMHVHWKALFSFGFAFWGLMCCTDLLGDTTWRRCSQNIEDILKVQYNEISTVQEMKIETVEVPKQKMSWPVLLWNICAFLCSLVFCSVLRSMSWIVWKLFKIYNIFRNRKLLTGKSPKTVENEENTQKSNCKVIFKNQLFAKNDAVKPDKDLIKELEDIRKEKIDLAQQLMMAQKENLTARQQIEEYKLETFMMKEKLARTANTLKENLRFKDFANANHEMIAKKAHSLEMHLKEVSRDRELLRNKLNNLEKNFFKLEEKLKYYEKQESESNFEQFPEKDTNKNNSSSEFQKKIMELQRSIGTFDPKKVPEFQANSKISVDLEDSSMDTSKENELEVVQDSGEDHKFDINLLKQNLLNYNAYKTQMLRPKLKLSSKGHLYSPSESSSSSDETSGPQRIISSTVEFQNFLKTLTSNSKSSINFNRSTMF